MMGDSIYKSTLDCFIRTLKTEVQGFFFLVFFQLLICQCVMESTVSLFPSTILTLRGHPTFQISYDIENALGRLDPVVRKYC